MKNGIATNPAYRKVVAALDDCERRYDGLIKRTGATNDSRLSSTVAILKGEVEQRRRLEIELLAAVETERQTSSASVKAKERLKSEIRAKKGKDQCQLNDHERRVNALLYSQAKGIDATSGVIKPVNSRKRLTWADHLRQIGAERPRQKWPRARAIEVTPNAAGTP